MSEPVHAMRANRRRRAGLAMLLVILLLMAVGSLLTYVLAVTALDRGMVQRQAPAQQAYWLVESGIERAGARLARDPSYRGETWQPEDAEFGSASGGTLTIRVEPAPGIADRFFVAVDVDYPRDSVYKVHAAKRVPLDLRKLKGTTP